MVILSICESKQFLKHYTIVTEINWSLPYFYYFYIQICHVPREETSFVIHKILLINSKTIIKLREVTMVWACLLYIEASLLSF